jgi:Rod binding domain-containing protein
VVRAMTENALNRATKASPAMTPGLARHQHLTRQAEKLVSQTFFGTLLKQMHESPFKSPLLDGGRGGQAFQPLMDQQLADRMARASGKKLVRGIVRQLEGREEYRRQSAVATRSKMAKPQAGKPYEKMRIHVTPGLGNNLRA